MIGTHADQITIEVRQQVALITQNPSETKFDILLQSILDYLQNSLYLGPDAPLPPAPQRIEIILIHSKRTVRLKPNTGRILTKNTFLGVFVSCDFSEILS